MRNLGDEFKWWFGKIEDVNDPLKIGRIRVRVYGWHTDDKGKIPTEDLPWAQPIQDITSAAMGDIGKSPTGLLVDSWVVGFFMDGKEAQRPVVMGSIAGVPDNIPDVDDRARGINNISKTPDSVIGEPADPFAAVYPKNHTQRTESGHLIELDDTPNAERIQVYHKSGTFIEIHPNGDVVTQHKNGWRSVTGNDKIHVTGDMSIVVDGNVDWQIGGNHTETIGGDQTSTVVGDVVEVYKSLATTVVDGITIIGGEFYSLTALLITYIGKIGLRGTGSLDIETDGDVNIDANNIDITGTGDVNITGSDVTIDPPL